MNLLGPLRLFGSARAAAVVGFFLCQWHSAWTMYGLPVLAAFGLWALLRGEFDTFPRPLAALEWAVLGFLSAFLLSASWGVDPARSWALAGAAWPAVLLYLLLRSSAGDDSVQRQELALAWSLLGLILAQALRLLWVIAQEPSAEPAQWMHGAASPWLVVPNDWSWVMVGLALICPLNRSYLGQQRKLRIAWWTMLAVAVIFAVVLRSRTAVLSALAAGTALAWYSRARWPVSRSLRPWLGSGVVVVLLAGLWDASHGFSLLGKFGHFNDTRFALWWAAWQIFCEHPWHGIGPHNYVALYSDYLPAVADILAIDPRLTPWPHQLFLEILASMGIMGLIAGIFLICFSCRGFMKLPPHSGIKAVLAGAGAAFIISALLEASLLRLWTWLMITLIFAAITNAERLSLNSAQADAMASQHA